MLESRLQKKILKILAEKYPNAVSVKIQSCNINGFPDILIVYNKKTLFVEIKTSRGRLSAAQRKVLTQLSKNLDQIAPGFIGHWVFVIRSVKDFKQFVMPVLDIP